MPPLQISLSSHAYSLRELCFQIGSAGPERWLALPSERLVQVFIAGVSGASFGDTRGGLPALNANELREFVLPLQRTPSRLLQSWKEEIGRAASSTQRRLALRSAVQRVITEQSYFGKVRDTAGFPAACGELIRELKQAFIQPGALVDTVERLPELPEWQSLRQKTAEINRIAAAFEEQLQRSDVFDEDDILHQSISIVRRFSPSLPEQIHVAGFYSFTEVQLEWLKALADHGASVTVHLQYDPDRELLFEPAARTLRTLLSRFGAIAAPGPDLVCQDYPAPLMTYLDRSLFHTSPDPPQGISLEDADFPLRILEAPGEMVEAEMVATRIFRLHRDQGVPYSECAILVRSVGEAVSRFRYVAQRLGIPLTTSTLEPLLENPAVQFLARLFELLPGEWPREDLLRVLRSSYPGLPLAHADALEREARKMGVLEGPERWLELAEAMGKTPLLNFVRHLLRWREALLGGIDPERILPFCRRCAAACLLGHAVWDPAPWDGLGPGMSLVPDPIAWKERCRLRNLLSPADRAALKTASEVAGDFAEDRLREGLQDGSRDPSTDPIYSETDSGVGRTDSATAFLRELLNAWNASSYGLPWAEGDRVRLLDAYAASPREFSVVFVAGLLEGSFPRRIGEDPFLRDDERIALARAGRPLSTSLERSDEERMLFYRAITAARDRLFLSYSRVTGEGKDCLASFYLDEIRALVPGLEKQTTSRTLADVAPLPGETITERDRACAIAVAAGDWRRGIDREFLDRCVFYHYELETAPELVARLCDGADRPPPFQLQCGWSPQDLTRSFGVSDIERFNECPYRFFAQKRLKLEVDRNAPDRLDKGEILHAVVQQFLGELEGSRLPDRETAVARLEEILDERLSNLRRDARPYQIRLLRHSLSLLLPLFYDREREYRSTTHLSPRYQEINFGFSGAARESGAQLDSASTEEPLVIEGATAGPVKIHGRMDRIDFTDDGLAVVIDYKLGEPKSLRKIEAGESLQIPLYFLALEKVFGHEVGAAFYDSFDRNTRSIIIRQDCVDRVLIDRRKANGGLLNTARFEQVLSTAKQKVVEVAEGVACCRIELQKGDHCRYCDYGDVCRVGR